MNRPRMLGLAVLLLGLLAMCSWLFRPDLAVSIGRVAGYLVFNTALCMLLSGLALSLLHSKTRVMVAAQIILGIAIFALAGAAFIQHVFGINTSVDWAFLHQDILKVRFPGRMSLMTSISFMLIGLVLMLMHQIRSATGGRGVQALILATLMLAIAGVSSHFLEFEVLFDNELLSFMSIPTAAAIMLTSLSLWLFQSNTSWFSLLNDDSPDKHILLSGAVILGLTAIFTALASYVSHVDALEKTLSDGLHLAIQSRVSLITHETSRVEQDAETIATRRTVIALLKSIDKNPQDAAASAKLQRSAVDLMKTGITAITFLDTRGKIVLTVGNVISNPDMAVILQSPRNSRLLWNGLYRLQTKVDVNDYDGQVGAVTTEQLAPIIAGTVENLEGMGKTGEVGLCAPMGSANKMACFPLRFKPETFTPPRVIDGEPLPLDYALRGLSGTIKSRDYRRKLVIAAYAPALHSDSAW